MDGIFEGLMEFRWYFHAGQYEDPEKINCLTLIQ
jgi:nitrogen fixation-related uncharacterized protein